MRIHTRLCILLVGLILVLSACGDDGNGNGDTDPSPVPTEAEDIATATVPQQATESPTDVVEPTATEPAATTATVAVTGTTEATSTAGEEIPDTPVGNALSWTLDMLNGETTLTEDEYPEHFAPEFIAAVPFEQFIDTNEQLVAAYGTFSFTGFAEPPTETQAVAEVLGTTGEELLLITEVDPAEPHLIGTLQITPASAADLTPVELADWDDFDAQLSELAPQVNFQAVELGEDMQPVHALNADQRLAIGSAFKLYILGELGRQIQAGELTWDDELAIREEWKSLPAGTMQDEPAGATFPLRRFAELMISISDNTATDHLLFHLGREQVEAMQAEMGHGDPGVNTPLLATREMFALKLSVNPAETERYIAASDEEQRQILENEIAQTPVSLEDASTWTSPRFIDSIEWFASPEDLTQAMASLRTMAEQPGLEPIMDILAINPGIPLDTETWTYAGFKGGSEPGVLNQNWLLQRADGRWFVVSASLNDDVNLIDEAAVIRLMGGAMQLLAETP